MPFRLTPQRRTILEELRQARDHPSAAELYRRVRARAPGVGFATVYKTLNLLAEHDLIQELQFGDAASHFDGNAQPHSHGICTRCQRIVDLEVNMSPEQVLAAARGQPFQASGYRLEFYGLCSQCLQIQEG